jgi:serine/threonine protein kinase
MSMSMLSTSILRGVDEIGPFQILEDLGPVPFGTAYLAVDSRSNQRALLKVIPPSRPGWEQEETPWEVLLQETRKLLRIYHRGIPPLFEVAEHDGALVVAFAAVTGPTLHDLMVQGKRPDRGLLVDWGGQLLDILAEAHAEGIVHRHITEDQIVVTPEGRLVLMGFGLTQIHFDPLAVFPPERSLGEPLTPKSDLYAVGLLLRRLAFASGLKGGRGPGAQRDPLLKVLARATFTDPAARFRDAREMADALRQASRTGAPALAAPRPARSAVRPEPSRPHPIAKLPSRAEPPRAPATEDRDDRKLASLLVVAAVVLMLMVIAAGWLLIGSKQGTEPVLPGTGTAAASTLPRMPS